MLCVIFFFIHKSLLSTRLVYELNDTLLCSQVLLIKYTLNLSQPSKTTNHKKTNNNNKNSHYPAGAEVPSPHYSNHSSESQPTCKPISTVSCLNWACGSPQVCLQPCSGPSCCLLLPSAFMSSPWSVTVLLQSVRTNPSFWLPWHVEKTVLVWMWEPQQRLPLPTTQWPNILVPQHTVAHLFLLLLWDCHSDLAPWGLNLHLPSSRSAFHEPCFRLVSLRSDSVCFPLDLENCNLPQPFPVSITS